MKAEKRGKTNTREVKEIMNWIEKRRQTYGQEATALV